MNPYNQMPAYNPLAGQQYPLNFNPFIKQPKRIPRVNGREGANAFQMDPGDEALLLDTNDPIVWLVQTDDAGVKTIDPLDIFKHVEPEQKNDETLEERITNIVETLEERVTKLEEAVQRESNSRNAPRPTGQSTKPTK